MVDLENARGRLTASSVSYRGIAYAILAAVLFGAGTPLSKILLRSLDPIVVAGLLYFGSGVGLGLFWQVRAWFTSKRAREARLSRADLPWLAGAVITGGVVAPVLLMLGLSTTPASTTSLLLNLEGVLSAALAWFVFKEGFDRRIALGMAAITAGGLLLSWSGRPEVGALWGPLLIAGACLSWAIDNNLTRKVSAGDPVQIAAVKGLVAGSVNMGIGFFAGARAPSISSASLTAIVGLFGYGISLTLFVLALRHIGTARTSAYFSIAPFVGAALSLMLPGETLAPQLLGAAALMGLGVWLHVTERHEHQHAHPEQEHEHMHEHDAHHQHAHDPRDPAGEPHTHPHVHAPLIHSHPHYPDIHHRHSH